MCGVEGVAGRVGWVRVEVGILASLLSIAHFNLMMFMKLGKPRIEMQLKKTKKTLKKKN